MSLRSSNLHSENTEAVERLIDFCAGDGPQARYKFSFGIEYSSVVDFVVDVTPRAHHPLARQYPAYRAQSTSLASAINHAIDQAIADLPAI